MTSLLNSPSAPFSAAPPRRDHTLPIVPLPPGTRASPNTPRRVRKDLRTLTLFVKIYCHAKHTGQIPAVLKQFDLAELAGRPIELCPDCAKLLHHSLVKRSACPRDPKPDCKHCPTPCYSPVYRQKMREVMRFSGMRLLLTGRIDYLIHYFF